MARLYLTFKDNELTATIDGIATTDTIGLEGVAEFFGWDGYSRTIVFYQNPRKPYRVVCHMDEFLFEVPHEVLTTDGPLVIGAFGVTDDGKRKVSTLATVVVTKGMYDENAIESIEPTPTEYEQMLAFMNAYMEAEHLVGSVAEAAERATEIAKEAITVEKNVAIEEAKAEISNASKAEKAEIETLSEEIIERAEGYADAAELSSIEAANSVGRISSVEKRLSNIEQSITPSPFVTDDSVAYAKAVPANALPYAEVNEIGGMCAVENGVLVSAPATKVKSVGRNLFDESIFFNTSNWVLDPNFSTGTTAAWLELGVFPAGDYVFDADCKRTDLTGVYLYVQTEDIFGTSGMSASVYQNSRPTFKQRKLKLGKPTKCRFWVYFGSITDDIAIYVNLFENIRIVRGTTEEENIFEPYKSVSLPIPDAVRNLNGYGLGINASAYNYIGFDKKQFGKRVGIVDMGTLSWGYGYDSYGGFYATVGDKKRGSTNIIASAYPTTSVRGTDKSIIGDDWNSMVYIYDSKYSSASEIKAAMSGVMLVYELAEPIVEDISDILPLDNYIEVFGGGAVYMENENKLDVPNKITYQIKEVT